MKITLLVICMDRDPLKKILEKQFQIGIHNNEYGIHI